MKLKLLFLLILGTFLGIFLICCTPKMTPIEFMYNHGVTLEIGDKTYNAYASREEVDELESPGAVVITIYYQKIPYEVLLSGEWQQIGDTPFTVALTG